LAAWTVGVGHNWRSPAADSSLKSNGNAIAHLETHQLGKVFVFSCLVESGWTPNQLRHQTIFGQVTISVKVGRQFLSLPFITDWDVRRRLRDGFDCGRRQQRRMRGDNRRSGGKVLRMTTPNS
jgi:hypothetical protein